MIPITETDDLYPAEVPLLEVTDPVLGGPSGPSNAAAIALANRTRYLKAALDALGPGGGSVENVGTGIGLYVGTEGGALQLLTLLEGDNITLTALPTGLRIDAVAGGPGGGSSGRYTVITTDFGAISDGSASSRSAFIAGHDSTPTTWPIVIPAGIYDLGGTDLVTDGRRYVLEGFVQFPNGKLRQSMFEQRDAMGSAEIWYDRGALMFETRTPFRLGGQSLTPALNIGSADPAQSAYGTVLFADGHSNFLAIKPEERYNPVEINLYSYAYSGRANGVPGTNRLIRNTTSCPASMPFQSDMVGKYIYFQGVKLRVLSRVSDDEITVALLGGGAVSFDFATEATYHFTYTMFRGTCSTNGTAVTWKGGHKFFGYLENWNPTSLIVINGTAYTVSDVADMEHLTLATSAGVQNDVEWIGYAEVDGETTALRLNHAITGEQLTLMTSAGALDGLGACFLIKTDRGVGDWNPIVVQNGGVDGLAVVYHPGTNTTRIGIGAGRRSPTAALDVNGVIRTPVLQLRNNALEDYASAGPSTIAINYSSHNGELTEVRHLDIYDGKGNLTAHFDGAPNGNSYIKKIPACLLRCTSALSFPQGAGTTITWDTEEHDSNGMHVPGASVVTVPVSGVYRISASYEINGTGDAANSNIITAIYILKNGTAAAASGFTRHRVAGGAAAGVGHSYSRDMALNANDTIAIQGYYGGQAGTTATLDNGFAYTSLSVTLVTAI